MPQVGPKPSALVQYGIEGALPPQIELQPVALPMTMRSPNSWVISFDVGSFPAAGAGPGELQQGLVELAALDRMALHQAFSRRQGLGVPAVFVLTDLGLQRFHHQGFFLGRADVGAVAAAETVQRIGLHPEMVVLKLLSQGRYGNQSFASGLDLFGGQQHRADGRVGADHGALVALNAVVDYPLGHVDGDAPLFVAGGSHRKDAVR